MADRQGDCIGVLASDDADDMDEMLTLALLPTLGRPTFPDLPPPENGDVATVVLGDAGPVLVLEPEIELGLDSDRGTARFASTYTITCI